MGEIRKLAAILVSDVVGYSRLAGADEDRTLAQLRALRSDLIDPTIALHHGRIVKLTGDGALVEFRSVLDAVRCAVNIAARLEVAAAPCAICLSEDAYRQVSGRLDMEVTDLGPTKLKNIERSIRLFAASERPGPDETDDGARTPCTKKSLLADSARRRRRGLAHRLGGGRRLRPRILSAYRCPDQRAHAGLFERNDAC